MELLVAIGAFILGVIAWYAKDYLFKGRASDKFEVINDRFEKLEEDFKEMRKELVEVHDNQLKKITSISHLSAQFDEYRKDHNDFSKVLEDLAKAMVKIDTTLEFVMEELKSRKKY